MNPATRKVSILPEIKGAGGPFTFKTSLQQGLIARGVQLAAGPEEDGCSSLLVIGGTRHLMRLIRARRRGVRIVQRLNGMNWMHKKNKSRPGYFIRCEVNNLLLAFIRRFLAHEIVYQSRFSQNWWESARGGIKIPSRIVYNGVDLESFYPQRKQPPSGKIRILMVEANIGGGYEHGLFHAIDMVAWLNKRYGDRFELLAIGKLFPGVHQRLLLPDDHSVVLPGYVDHARLPELFRDSQIYFSADINAACPNSLLEALASGVPAIGFDTGALPEIISHGAGITCPYGANYWNLEKPDAPALAEAAMEIAGDLEKYQKAARVRAETEFDVNRMVEKYLDVLC